MATDGEHSGVLAEFAVVSWLAMQQAATGGSSYSTTESTADRDSCRNYRTGLSLEELGVGLRSPKVFEHG